MLLGANAQNEVLIQNCHKHLLVVVVVVVVVCLKHTSTSGLRGREAPSQEWVVGSVIIKGQDGVSKGHHRMAATRVVVSMVMVMEKVKTKTSQEGSRYRNLAGLFTKSFCSHIQKMCSRYRIQIFKRLVELRWEDTTKY